METTKGRILCVDENRDTLEMMNAVLGSQGYEVIKAQNVAEGLSQGVAADFDLILLDWAFEDGTGIDLCKMLRSTGTSSPILFYSGVSDGHDVEGAMHAGAQGFLIKPVDSIELLQSLSRLLNSHGISTEQSTRNKLVQ